MWELGLLRKLRLRAKVTCPSSQSRSMGHQELVCKYQMPLPFSPLQHTASRHWTELTWTNPAITVWQVSSTSDKWVQRQQSPQELPFLLQSSVVSQGRTGHGVYRSQRGGGADNSPLCQILGTIENVDQTSLKQAWDIQWLDILKRECWPNIIKTSLRYPVAEGSKKHQISMNLPGSNFITLIAASSPVLTFRA